MTLTTDVMDRRKAGPQTPADIVPAVIRLEETAIQILKAHDRKFANRDPEVWQTDYSLLVHSANVSKMHAEVGIARKLKNNEVVRRRVSGKFHDVGKDDRHCHIYRLRRELAPAEREDMTSHASHSALAVLDALFDKPVVRARDALLLAKIHPSICFHHIPWVVPEQNLRRETIDLKLVDEVVGWMENRHRPGVPLAEALDRVEAELRTVMVPLHYRHLQRDFEESFEMVKSVFLSSGQGVTA